MKKVNRPATNRTKSVTIAAPIGGWNARDPLGAMGKLDAVSLVNFWPGTNSVILRGGFTKHATGIVGQVETLMTYSGGGTNTMFAIAGTQIYNVTSAGAVGAAVLTGLTNARWQYVNFTTTANSYLLLVNNADKMKSWNGTTWQKDGDGAPYNVTGFDTATATNIVVFKNRIWLCENNTLKAWYLPINAIGGAATSLDMSSICSKGGYLMAAMTWTLDAGFGIDDYLVFITSNGETLVWRLTDPTTPTGITLQGVYTLGAPIGRRCWMKYGGDLLIITVDGVVPLSAALASSRLTPVISITDKIQYAVGAAVRNYGSNFGWQLFFYPKRSQLYLNVPVSTGRVQEQYVQNNITKAWCRFTGWSANCWELLNDNPYFGANTYVGRAWNGTTGDAATDIKASALQSFQAYGGARQKQCRMVRYNTLTDGSPKTYGDINVDYDLADRSVQLIASATNYGIWDTGLWDTAIWGSDLVPSGDWQGATTIGYAFAPFFKVAAQGLQAEWVSTDMIFEAGGEL